jgi:hypothetical protein
MGGLDIGLIIFIIIVVGFGVGFFAKEAFD